MAIGRRDFLKGVAGVAGALAIQGRVLGEAEDAIVMGVPVTHSDWILKPGIDPGAAGVRHMLDACKACGWSRVYWRVLDGGRAMWPSKVVKTGDRWDEDSFWSPQSEADKALVKRFGDVPAARRQEILDKFGALDYSAFDALGEAVRYGHEIGLKVHVWVTINEDDHGWGLVSDFAKAHPAWRWVKRDGAVYRSQMSFAYPEVRAYKMAIFRELLGNYPIDGIFLDWIRTGDVRDNPQTDGAGVADSGYERPNVEAFTKEFGEDAHKVANDDPRWVALRARAQTEFMREVKNLVSGRVPVSAMVGHPWHYRGFGDKIDGSLRGLLLDVRQWAREGLVDAVVAAGYYRDGGDATKAFGALKEETEGKVPVWMFGWVPTTAAQLETDAGSARKLGAAELLLWEGDYIDDRANAAELKQVMRARARM